MEHRVVRYSNIADAIKAHDLEIQHLKRKMGGAVHYIDSKNRSSCFLRLYPSELVKRIEEAGIEFNIVDDVEVPDLANKFGLSLYEFWRDRYLASQQKKYCDS